MLILSDNGTRYLSVPSLAPEEECVGSGASPELHRSSMTDRSCVLSLCPTHGSVVRLYLRFIGLRQLLSGTRAAWFPVPVSQPLSVKLSDLKLTLGCFQSPCHRPHTLSHTHTQSVVSASSHHTHHARHTKHDFRAYNLQNKAPVRWSGWDCVFQIKSLGLIVKSSISW